MADEPTGFLGRWSRRKVDITQGKPLDEPVEKTLVAAPPASDATGPVAPAAQGQAPREPLHKPLEDAAEKKALTLADAKLLTKDSDFKPFMAGDVTPDVRNAAMKQLFADPHFNVMDGLDIYIDDYSKSDPIPESMLRQMVSAKFLNLFDDEEDKENKEKDTQGEVKGEIKKEAKGEAHGPITGPQDDLANPPRESANNPTVQTVAQSYENPDIAPSQTPGALSTSQFQPQPAGASQEDHAHTDLRLQPDHAAPAPGSRRGTQ
ncbi:DUF3306 domain-containing protein [Polaromonas sp.]|uniref:DUF3306 domain-containing protein n=1 Tax=Polaromonas sp. TaxID=1869339 RepID=UPI003264616E